MSPILSETLVSPPRSLATDISAFFDSRGFEMVSFSIEDDNYRKGQTKISVNLIPALKEVAQ